jgi:hypothetical protein
MKENPYLKSAILEVVETQLKRNDPPETRQTFDRLISEGYSVEDSKKLIGSVVVVEIFEVVKKQETFNPERFAKALRELPKLRQD